MFDKNFNAETSIKKWASIIRTIGIVFMVLCGLAAFIMLCYDFEVLWWVSLSLIAVGGITILCTSLSSVLIWGFGELVGSAKKNTNDAMDSDETSGEEALPEL